MLAAMIRHEDIAIAYYGDDDYNQRCYTHPNHEDLKNRFEAAENLIKNPFHEAYIWLKGEYLNLIGMLDCLKGRELVMEHQLNLEKRIVNDTKTLNNIKGNKTTLTNFWKTKSSKEAQGVTLQN